MVYVQTRTPNRSSASVACWARGSRGGTEFRTLTARGSPASASNCRAAGTVSRSRIWRPARNDDQVRDLRGLEGGRLRPGRRVDHDQLDTQGASGIDRVRETGRLNVGHHRGVRLAAVPPLAGARRRVSIEDDNRTALVDGLDGDRQRDARLADAAFLCEQGYDLHGWYTVLRVYMFTSHPRPPASDGRDQTR